ncbi:MAG: hypothetical protein RBR32_03730 [Bacteroidales bacterium]|nr:hypothetical protein [Bacteroidales bacterium]
MEDDYDSIPMEGIRTPDELRKQLPWLSGFTDKHFEKLDRMILELNTPTLFIIERI